MTTRSRNAHGDPGRGGRAPQRGRNVLRRAAVAVEMAVVTPLLLSMLFGIIEYGWAFTVRQGLITAAREGARVASLQGSTEAEITQRIREYLQPLGLTTYEVQLTRATPENPTETVRVQIPYADISLVGCYFGNQGGMISATCSMRKEGMQ